MKQKQFSIRNRAELDEMLTAVRTYYNEHSFYGLLLQVYTEIMDREKIENVLEKIREALPEAEYVGCTSNGSIVEGDFSGESFAVICSFFERPDTRIRVLTCPLTEETQKEAAAALVREVKENDWVKGVLFYVTITGMSMTGLCEGLSEIPNSIRICGGGAFGRDLNKEDSCVFGRESGILGNGIVYILLGGPDLHMETDYVSGWRPLGSWLDVTSARGAVLHELNGLPAYETYYKYLRIRNDDHFFFHTLEFPFLFRDGGLDIMRAPVSCLKDGSLVMTSDIRQDTKMRMAYGDPWTILDSTYREAERLSEFGPDAFVVFSCAGRRTFWGNDKVGEETACYESVAPTSGFYTSSEFLMTNGRMIQHNVTQVIAAIREGQPKEPVRKNFPRVQETFEGEVPMIHRMASFVNATMQELEEANRKLETMAIMDGLTGLYNRTEIQRLIHETVECRRKGEVCLIMLDLDDFKRVNDLYGHKEGDEVLIRFSEMIRDSFDDLGFGKRCDAGRWGGEEFMILMSDCSGMDAVKHAEQIRKGMEGLTFEKAGRVTVSVGVISVREGETADQACARVDEALYRAKKGGKNRVCSM